MKFAAIDVETANPKRGSICQIGIAVFIDGALCEEWSTLIDPEDDFHSRNISIHGIQKHMVAGQPCLPQVANQVRALLEGTISVCYSDFDRQAIEQAFNKYGLPSISTSWLDATLVVRRSWPEFSRTGYSLLKVCKKIGYDFRHHDALEDAKATGHVLLAAMRESQEDLEILCQRIAEPPCNPAETRAHFAESGRVNQSTRKLAYPQSEVRDGNPEGRLFGEVLVFTGSLDVRINLAADMASEVGCRVEGSLTRKATILVVGRPDLKTAELGKKTTKHDKAIALAATGHPIKILTEMEFFLLVQDAKREV